MISKNRLKELAAYRQQKRCDEEAVFVVEGPKIAAEAMASGFGIRVVCATADYAMPAIDGECYEVSQAELERLSLMKSPNRVWMLVERPLWGGWRSEVGGQSAVTLVLDRIQDPGNLGTMLRTADWFGIRRVVCSRDTVSCYNPKVVQASMGAVFRTQVEYVDLPKWLNESGMPVYGASLQGQSFSTLSRPVGAAALVIGNESAGISPEVMQCVSHPVLIPNIGGTAESLNASVAAGILMGWMCL